MAFHRKTSCQCPKPPLPLSFLHVHNSSSKSPSPSTFSFLCVCTQAANRCTDNHTTINSWLQSSSGSSTLIHKLCFLVSWLSKFWQSLLQDFIIFFIYSMPLHLGSLSENYSNSSFKKHIDSTRQKLPQSPNYSGLDSGPQQSSNPWELEKAWKKYLCKCNFLKNIKMGLVDLRWAWNWMSGVLIQERQKEIWKTENRHVHKDWRFAAPNQGTCSEWVKPCLYLDLDFELLDSKSLRKYISVISEPQFIMAFLGS